MVTAGALSHLMWGAPDLDRAGNIFTRLAGTAPAFGGVHPGRGTRNALAGIGAGRHVEILAPDPAQPTIDNAMTRRLHALDGPCLLHYYCHCPDLDAAAAVLAASGIRAQGPLALSRRRSNGMLLEWRLLWPEPDAFGPCLPILIDWGQAEHPSRAAPHAADLLALEIGHPRAAALGEILGRLAVPFRPCPADRPYLLARLQAGGRSIALTGPS
ncbi:MAG: VOC family protein [Rhodospirillaceae bacterium]|nr:VOC family protein [Rhodospirillaceae bacterium]